MLTLNIVLVSEFVHFEMTGAAYILSNFFHAPSKLKQLYLHLFHLFCIMLFFFFEILQTIGLLIFNKCVALECEPKVQVSPLHGLQQILDSPIQNLALNRVEFL